MCHIYEQEEKLYIRWRHLTVCFHRLLIGLLPCNFLYFISIGSLSVYFFHLYKLVRDINTQYGRRVLLFLDLEDLLCLVRRKSSLIEMVSFMSDIRCISSGP